MEERDKRIVAAKILQGIVIDYMNPVKQMSSANDETFEKWMRLVEGMDKKYEKDPFFEQVLLSLTAEGYLPGGEKGLGIKPKRELLASWQIEDLMKEFYNSILERTVKGVRYSLQVFKEKYIGSGVIFSENLIKAYNMAYSQVA